MRTFLASLLAVCSLLATCGTATAQEKGQAGLAMGYPASVSLMWHATDDVAIRVDFNLSQSTSENSLGSGYSSTNDSLSLGFSVGPIFYLSKAGNLRTYVSPRFTWSHSTTENTGNLAGVESEISSRTLGATGQFGAQYQFSDRFGAFGEVGITYSDLHAEHDPSTTESNGWGWGTRSAVGVILYF